MKLVAIREDDVSFFTDPKKLEKLYAPILEGGHSVSFSVIPKVACNIALPEDNPYRIKEGLAFEPFVPPVHRGKEEVHDVSFNRALLKFLKDEEVLQHGFTHGRVGDIGEFMIKDNAELKEMIGKGQRILEGALGKTPEFFVPPWDFLSKEALSLLPRYFKGTSLFKLGGSMLPAGAFPSYLLMRGRKKNYMRLRNFLTLEHPGCLTSRFEKKGGMKGRIRAELKKSCVLVIVNHHWEFFFDWGELNRELFDEWMSSVDYILNRKDVEITTFSDLWKRLP